MGTKTADNFLKIVHKKFVAKINYQSICNSLWPGMVVSYSGVADWTFCHNQLLHKSKGSNAGKNWVRREEVPLFS